MKIVKYGSDGSDGGSDNGSSDAVSAWGSDGDSDSDYGTEDNDNVYAICIVCHKSQSIVFSFI